ncbi:hypothetical protein C0Q70_19363 [Pomacea canaliculata]|uniref:Uncharacterized protein n=1 Tax=Pomacea canaliculata TaxID=400727 RepID=A0A2T7NJ51_POMCA|nr:hypothetical protein C0Q70_19363 [Pomacea canaliculata]
MRVAREKSTVLQAREATLDAEVENIKGLIEDLTCLRNKWESILVESKNVAVSCDVAASSIRTNEKENERNYVQMARQLIQKTLALQKIISSATFFYRVLDCVIGNMTSRYDAAKNLETMFGGPERSSVPGPGLALGGPALVCCLIFWLSARTLMVLMVTVVGKGKNTSVSTASNSRTMETKTQAKVQEVENAHKKKELGVKGEKLRMSKKRSRGVFKGDRRVSKNRNKRKFKEEVIKSPKMRMKRASYEEKRRSKKRRKIRQNRKR